MESLLHTPVTAAQIKGWTKRDPLLSKVLQYVERGWPNVQPTKPSMSPFWTRRGEFSTHEGCILWGSRVVVPLAGRHQLLQELHAGHQGMAKMKSLVHSFFWWPKLDADIEAVVNVSKLEECHHQHHCTNGVGRAVHGLESTWITQVLLRTRCFWC